VKILSTRGRVAIVVVLSAVPALGWMVYGALEQRYVAEAHAREDLQRYARLAAKQQEQALEGARQLLFALSGVVPALMRDRQACHEYFRGLMLAGHGLYHSLGVHLANGELHCNAVTWNDGVNVSDRYYFRAAAASGKFTVGGYQTGRATVREGIDFGYPVMDADQKVVGVVFAGLDLKRFTELASATPQPPGAVVTIFDRDAELQGALRESRELAITDPLTGLHNRRYLWELLGRELLKARRNRTPVAAILADIDHFKRFNDTWGHEAGDLVLKRVADVIREHVRGSDIGCRYGGEELAVILPETTLQVAVERAERIRRGIAAVRLDYGGRPLDAVTSSFGVAIYPQHAGDAETLLRAADEALYEAKKAGRDRVVVSQATSTA
jgi:diguanylate cyclase (GGDEF)-like protein